MVLVSYNLDCGIWQYFRINWIASCVVTHDYAIGNPVYVEMTVNYQKIYCKKQGPYIITELCTNGTVQFQTGTSKQTNKYKTVKASLQ